MPYFTNPLFIIGALALLALVVLPQFVRICQEWERGVILRLGKFERLRGPGLILLIPMVEKIIKVDLRVVVMEVTAQEVITKDNVTIKVNAVVFLRVVTPENAIIQVEDYQQAVSQYSQSSLRSIIGQSELDDILVHRDDINQRLQQIIDEATEAWGVKVTAVEIKDVELPNSMQRAMARQAEAEREKRAKVIHADGEYQAAQKLADAAEQISDPAALQLRYLQTLVEVSVEKSSTILFPVPIDTLKSFTQSMNSDNGKRRRPATV
jgi:regulator of protease activity HflC (stomatin/prohibitin superfamily)